MRDENLSLEAQFSKAINDFADKNNGKAPTLAEIGFKADVETDDETGYVTSVEFKKIEDENKENSDGDSLSRTDVCCLIDNNHTLNFLIKNMHDLHLSLSNVFGVLQYDNLDPVLLTALAEKALPIMNVRIKFLSEIQVFLEHINKNNKTLILLLIETTKLVKEKLAPEQSESKALSAEIAAQFEKIEKNLKGSLDLLTVTSISLSQNEAGLFSATAVTSSSATESALSHRDNCASKSAMLESC